MIRPVIRITGRAEPVAASRSTRATPLIPGRLTSAISKSARSTAPALRKSSADAKVNVSNAADRNSCCSAVRTALQQLLRSAAFDTLTFASAEDFLSAGAVERADLLIADVNLPGISGVALVLRLAATGSALPVILMTGRIIPAGHQ